MSDLLIGFLVCLPLEISLVMTAVFWRQLPCLPLFLAVAIFSLLGVQSLFAPVAIAIFLPNMGGLTVAAANEAFARSISVGAAVQIVVGIPLLCWLKNALRKP